MIECFINNLVASIEQISSTLHLHSERKHYGPSHLFAREAILSFGIKTVWNITLAWLCATCTRHIQLAIMQSQRVL